MGRFLYYYAWIYQVFSEKKSIHMSTRNPMNDRYQTDGPKGRPKICLIAQAEVETASSVYVKSTQKTPQEKERLRKSRSPKAGRARPQVLQSAYGSGTKSTRRICGACSAALYRPHVGRHGRWLWWPDNPTMTWCFLIPCIRVDYRRFVV